MQEFGGQTEEEEAEAEAEEDIAAATKQQAPGIDDAKNKSDAIQRKGAGTGKLEGRLIVREKRTTGSVSWKGDSYLHWSCFRWLTGPITVYGDYIAAARAYFTGPLLILCMLAMQGTSVMNSYTLIWWQAKYVLVPFVRRVLYTHCVSVPSTSQIPSTRSYMACSVLASLSSPSPCE